MTNSKLKNREQMSTSIHKGYLKRLKDISEETRIPISKLIDEAIEYLFQKYGK